MTRYRRRYPPPMALPSRPLWRTAISTGVLLLVATGVLFLVGEMQPIDLPAGLQVIDGDSIRDGAREIRLYGIDAPEYRQRCLDASGRSYACGKEARQALERLIAGRPVTCRTIDADRYRRSVAICRAGEDELNRLMVREGWAIAYTRHALDYAGEEADARQAGRGVWQGRFEDPEDYRAGRRNGFSRSEMAQSPEDMPPD